MRFNASVTVTGGLTTVRVTRFSWHVCTHTHTHIYSDDLLLCFCTKTDLILHNPSFMSCLSSDCLATRGTGRALVGSSPPADQPMAAWVAGADRFLVSLSLFQKVERGADVW